MTRRATAHAAGALIGLAASLLCPGSRALAGAAAFHPLGDLPGGPFFSFAYDVSADGSTVVGYSQSSPSPGSREAFRWTEAGGMIGLGDFAHPTPQSDAQGVSADGSVIVGRGTGDAPWESRAFRWTQETGMQALADTAGEFVRSQAYDVSPDGSVVVGMASSTTANQAFRWTAAAGMTGLGWLPSTFHDSFAFDVSSDGATVCGLSNAGSGGVVEAFRWRQPDGMTSLGDVPGGVPYAIAWAVSGDGSVIAGAARTEFDSRDEAFLWSEAGGFVLPDPLHGAESGSAVFALTGDGSTAVGYGGAGAMIWDAAHGMRSLQALLADEYELELPGWTLWTATAISPDGRAIAGSGLNPAGEPEAWLVRLPGAAASVRFPEAERAAFSLRLRGANPSGGDCVLALALAPAADEAAGGGALRVVVYDTAGRLVRVLFEGGSRGADRQLVWDGRDAEGRRVPPGLYLARAVSGARTAGAKIVRR